MASATIPGRVQASLDTPEDYAHYFPRWRWSVRHGFAANALCGVLALELSDPGTGGAELPKCPMCQTLLNAS